jgi:hypothetical protein
MEYKRFKKAWKDLIDGQYKAQMLEYENAQDTDVEFTDIILQRISSCAEDKKPNFWSSVTVLLDVGADEDTNPMPTRYYIKTTPQRVSLQHDFMEENFTELWDTPSYVEKELVKALLADIVEEHEMCFEEFTKVSFDILFDQHYLSESQFSDEAKMKYYEMYGRDSLLPQEARELFIF